MPGRRPLSSHALAGAALALASLAALPARAQLIADPQPAPVSPPRGAPQTLALLRTTMAPGDKALEDLVKSALEDRGRLRVVRAIAGADLVGRLSIARPAGDTLLELRVTRGSDALVVDALQTIVRGHSPVDGALALAARVLAAIDGTRAPAAASPPPSSSAPATATEPAAPARAAASAPPAGAKEEDEDDDDPRKRLDFIAGLELAGGLWSVSPSGIINGSSGFDFHNYAQAFTQPIDHKFTPALALHGGWKFLGYGAFELAYEGSRFSNGAATLWGVRFSGYPLTPLWPDRKFDLGFELGGGYSFLNGGSYDMSGTYFTFGVTLEWPLNKWLGVVGFYRLFTPFLKNFYIDYGAGRSEPVSGETAFWNSIGIGLNIHPVLKW